jgi:hypothetical protein
MEHIGKRQYSMSSIKQFFTRRLTRRETALAIVVVAILLGLGYLACDFVATKVLEARVNAALPKVCESILQQRQTLLSAIEAYKVHFGVYPPDNVIGRQPLAVDAVNNPLLYELVGVTYNPTDQTFELGHLEAAEAKFVKEFFRCDGFTNCAEQADQVQHFLTSDPLPAHHLHDDPDVYVVSVFLANVNLDREVSRGFSFSSWRYVSSVPTHNPGKFDLWIEIKANGQSVTIGNWPSAE